MRKIQHEGIKTMKPIKKISDIERMKLALPSIRDRMLFTLGCNSSLRISDIVKIKCDDVRHEEIIIREQKTGKIKAFRLNTTIMKELRDFANAYPREYLFKTRQSEHISEHQALVIIKAAAKKCNLEHIGTHSMRKTFGYQALQQHVNIAYISEAYNHSSLAITRRYLDITQDELNDKLYSQMAL